MGDALVAQLGLDQSNDILGRWMAHHLARLIDEAKTAKGEEKAALEQKCFDAVLALWKHRNCLPHGYRPFEPAEGLLGTLEALDPDAPAPFYGRVMLQWDDLDEADRPTESEVSRFEIVRRFDRSARTVIRHLLGCAVEDLPNDTREWVRRAAGAGLQGADVIVIRRMLASVEPASLEQEAAKAQAQRMRSLLEDLDVFLETGAMVRGDISRRLIDAEINAASSSKS